MRAWKQVWPDLMTQRCAGVDLVAQAHAVAPRMPIIALCRHGHELCVQRALGCGASGYVACDADAEELVRALRRIVHGGRYLSASLSGKQAAAAAQLHDALSRREFQILRLIGAGRTQTEIAGELALSVKTVATYRARVLNKMRMRSNAELTRYAFANELIA